MAVTPILVVLFAGGILIAATFGITPRQAWRSVRGRVEALEELQRRQARRREIVRTLPDFLGNLLVGYGIHGHVLDALEFAARLGGHDDGLCAAVVGALRQGRLSEDKYPSLLAMASDLGDPLLSDFLRLLQQAEEEGGDIAAILESYLEHAYQRKSTQLLEQAKVLPLQLLGITVPLLLPTLVLTIVGPFAFAALQAWTGR